MQQKLTKPAISLISGGAELTAKNSYGETPLMNAAEKGLSIIVKLMLKNGANAGVVDRDGKTALDYAKENGHKTVAKVLKRGH